MELASYNLIYNFLSFAIAAFGASTIFFFAQRSQVAPAYKTALTLSGLVCLIAFYHYLRLFNSFNDAYLIDGKSAPYIDMIPGKTYRFDQSDSTNNGHPIKFYTTADKSEEYTTGVKRFSSDSDIYANYNPPGTGTEAYVEIVVSDSTPALLFYQCQSHGLMGNQIQVKGVGGGGGSSLTLKDEGSALSTAATTLKFVGDGVRIF